MCAINSRTVALSYCMKGSLDINETFISWQDSTQFLIGGGQQKNPSVRDCGVY